MKITILDNDTRPHRAQNLVLGDDRSTGLNEQREKVEGAAAEIDRHAPGAELAPIQHKLKATESEVSIFFGHRDRFRKFLIFSGWAWGGRGVKRAAISLAQQAIVRRPRQRRGRATLGSSRE